MSTNQTAAEKQAARLKNVRISHKKDAQFGITLDLSAFVNRALTEADQCKPNGETGVIKSYSLASTGGFINLQAPGFEDVQVSVNVITSKAKYDAKVAAELAAQARAVAHSPAPSAPALEQNAIMLQMMEQMQAMQAKIEELSKPKRTRKPKTVQE